MLLAEDLLVLLTDDESGKFVVDGSRLDLALAGACVIDLAMLGRIDVAGANDVVKAGRLVVRDEKSAGDALLDDVLKRCAERSGAKPANALGKLRKGLRGRLLGRLVERGILQRTDRHLLGIFPMSRWPAVDSAHERRLVEQLAAALLRGTVPEPRTAALAGLLSAVDAAHKVVDAPDKKAVRRRAKEIRESQWATDAVGKAIEAVESAVMVAIMAATVSAGAAGAGT